MAVFTVWHLFIFRLNIKCISGQTCFRNMLFTQQKKEKKMAVDVLLSFVNANIWNEMY